MLLSEDFKFNNVLASSLGLKLVRMDSSMFIQEPTIGGANLVEAEHPYDFKQYLYKVKKRPPRVRPSTSPGRLARSSSRVDHY